LCGGGGGGGGGVVGGWCIWRLAFLLYFDQRPNNLQQKYYPDTAPSNLIMRLLTHNYLKSNVKGTENGFPLKIEATEVVVEESPMDTELLTNLLPKLEYSAIVSALEQVSEKMETKPPQIPESLPEGNIDTATLEALHHVLFDIHIIEGDLICPGTGRKFPVKQGIPNMILHEDEL
jgi:multifunctional methyltransferase subunit TRM112